MNTFSNKLRISEWNNVIHLINQTLTEINQSPDNKTFNQLYDQLARSYMELILLHENIQADIHASVTQFKKMTAIFLLLENMDRENCPAQTCADTLNIDVSIIRQAYKKIEENPETYKSEVYSLLKNKLPTL